MRSIRIALAEMHHSLRRLVEAGIADEPDLVLVGSSSSEIALMLSARDADVVVASMRGAEPPAIAERLLDEYPDLGVVCIDVVGGQGLVYRLQPRATRLAAISPEAIAAAIRMAATEADHWKSDDLHR
ncbi:hypothetical protein HP550_15800 [Cellulomonas humilata]|uniref:Response regulatory domain-containing protein n=1 Tax=Cellulomonas humilata TaxID=144055 RepID=A0A7Y6A2T6_9CELL|nr:hypothetical protein [Cellulomonas humilata]NUU18718.1 hypothetical protein [Cellulomonas humilata]